MRKGSKHSEESKRKMSDIKKDYIPWNKGKKLLKPAWNKGLTKDIDIRVCSPKPEGFGVGEKNSQYGKKGKLSAHYGKRSGNWKGGDVDYWHKLAFKNFGNNICELCNDKEINKRNNKIIRLAMHCTSIPKDYSIMTKENWMCVCHKCHVGLDAHL